MTGYLIEIEKKETKKYVVMAQSKAKAEILANALSMCEDNIDLDIVDDIFVPLDDVKISCVSNTLAESHDCEDILDAMIDFTGDSDDDEDTDSDENDDDYEPEEYFSD